MVSLGTDFETHAIWQGYVEDPAAKDFVARKACTIALSAMEVSTTFQDHLIHAIPKHYTATGKRPSHHGHHLLSSP